MPDSGAGSYTLELRGGYLRVPAAVADAVLPACATVAVLRDPAGLRVFPVHDAAQGGRLLKVRNAAGDRVVHIGDLLESAELTSERMLGAGWNATEGVLVVPLAEESPT